ncbi:MAG TPA: hypothetical protein VES61_03935 [Gaiellaceae bacterium]|nr:hypothetical protein [Gaiellaceae bacterium]
MATERDEMKWEEAQPQAGGQDLDAGAPVPLRRPTRAKAISGRLKGTLRWRPSARPEAEAPTRRQVLHWRMREELWNELTRSRRYGRSFLLLRIQVPRPAAVAQTRRARRAVERYKSDGGLLHGVFRRIDRVWEDEDDFYVLLPECDRSKGDAVIGRVRALLVDSLGEAEIAMAAFPDDGVTSGALLVALRRRSSHWQEGRASHQPELALAAGEVAGSSSFLADAVSVGPVLAGPKVEANHTTLREVSAEESSLPAARRHGED